MTSTPYVPTAPIIQATSVQTGRNAIQQKKYNRKPHGSVISNLQIHHIARERRLLQSNAIAEYAQKVTSIHAPHTEHVRMERKHAHAQRKPALARETQIVHCRRIAIMRIAQINLASLKQQRAVPHVQIPIMIRIAPITVAVAGFQPQLAYIQQDAAAREAIVPVHAIEALHHVRCVRMLRGLVALNRELRRVILQKQMP